MKKSPFITFFVATNVLFLFLYIHKASQCMNASYRKQELEKEKSALEHLRNNLLCQCKHAQMKESITDYAQHQLGMQPIRISKIKKMSSDKDGAYHD